MSNLLAQVAEPRGQYNPKLRWQYDTCTYCGGKKKRYAKACIKCIRPLKKPQTKKPAVERPCITQPDDPSIRHLALTRGQVTVVDAEEFERANALNWSARKTRQGGYYAACGAFKKNGHQFSVRLHNFIMNAAEGQQYDHIDGDGLNNRKTNLRPATSEQNAHNRRRGRANTTGYIGVHRDRKRKMYRVCLTCSGVRYYGGWFVDLIAAAKARDALAVEHHGEFAHLNFPDHD